MLGKAGLPEPIPQRADRRRRGDRRGELVTASGHLQRLLGRPSTPVNTTFANAFTAEVSE